MTYIDLPTLKSALSITDQKRDTLLEQAIAAGVGFVNRQTGRTFGKDDAASARTYRVRGRVVLGDDGEALLVDDIASLDGLVVEVGDGTTFTELTDYDVEPDNAPDDGWPVTRIRLVRARWAGRRARITAAWGWPAVPEDIRQATLLQAMRWYRRKDSPEGVAGSAEWGLIRIPHIDPDVKALIGPYMVPGFG